MLFYWLSLNLLLWTFFSIRDGRAETFDYHLRSFTDCMAGGTRKDHDCQKSKQDLESDSNPIPEMIYFILIGFLNFASLPFVVQFQTVKHQVRRVTQKFSTKSFK